MSLTFRCHICGVVCGRAFYLLSMLEREVDHPFVICSKRCCERADAAYYARVKIKERKLDV